MENLGIFNSISQREELVTEHEEASTKMPIVWCSESWIAEYMEMWGEWLAQGGLGRGSMPLPTYLVFHISSFVISFYNQLVNISKLFS